MLAIRRIFSIISGKRQTDKFHLLQQQHYLLHQGMDATAEVIETALFEEKVGCMFPVKLWIKLKKADGSYIYFHTNTLVTLSHIPFTGQNLRIKYAPRDLSTILILN